jgi:hypothetical protein
MSTVIKNAKSDEPARDTSGEPLQHLGKGQRDVSEPPPWCDVIVWQGLVYIVNVTAGGVDAGLLCMGCTKREQGISYAWAIDARVRSKPGCGDCGSPTTVTGACSIPCGA